MKIQRKTIGDRRLNGLFYVHCATCICFKTHKSMSVMLLILTILRFQGRTACDPFHTASLHVFQKGHANKQRLQQDVYQ